MKRLIITSDVHLGFPYPYSKSVHPFQDLFSQVHFACLKELIDYAIKWDADIAILGDFFDKDSIQSPEFVIASWFFDEIERNNIRLYMNIGNHEIEYGATIPPVIQTLSKRYKSFFMPKNDSEYEVFDWEGLNMYFVPYKKDQEFSHILEKITNHSVKKPAGLFVHQNIYGMPTNVRDKIRTGMTERELSKILKNHFIFIACGHLHAHHSTTRFGMPIIIPGSICSTDFKDEGTIKKFFVLSGKDCIYESVPFSSQIIFNTISLEEAQSFLQTASMGHNFLKIRYGISQSNEFNKIKEDLEKRNYTIIPDIISEDSDQPIVTGYKPLKISDNEWLKIYMSHIGMEDEYTEMVVNLNNELFHARS